MTYIKKLVELIDDELCGAKRYAEKYVEEKSKGNIQKANKYKEMANDELKHSSILHTFTVSEIETLRRTYQPTEEMQEKWDISHKKYVEKSAWIMQMLNM